ncbi:MAG: class I SAM-dependent methyltransferase [Cuspidothrix sp.]
METSNKWVENLRDGGYEHHCSSHKDFTRIKKLRRIWLETIKRTQINSPATAFELGCGGGCHLAALAVNGFQVHGIDVSPQVVDRCQNYLNEVSQFAVTPISATVENADIFEYETNAKYDLVYHFGVIEHFLELSERMIVWEKLYQLTKPGGWMMSAVPNGSHFWREYIRQNNLCGYHIPEIDYSVKLHQQEFLDSGLVEVIAIPWNYFGFAEGIVKGRFSKGLARVVHLSSNLLMPLIPIANTTKEKFAHGLLVLGRKSG